MIYTRHKNRDFSAPDNTVATEGMEIEIVYGSYMSATPSNPKGEIVVNVYNEPECCFREVWFVHE